MQNRTVGAELEFLPSTEISLFSLSDRARSILLPIYQLQYVKQTRQPKTPQLLNILHTAIALDAFLRPFGYSASLNMPDIEKIIKRLRKTADKYDKLICHIDLSIDGQVNGQVNGMTIAESVERLERAIARVNDYLRPNGQFDLPSVAIGFDNSVRGTTPTNECAQTDYPFDVYSGLEVVFPVCHSVDELSDLYSLVVYFLKSVGCIFPTSAGVHLHVGVGGKSGRALVNQLANTFIIGAAFSAVIAEILPEHRKQNDFCRPMGADVTEHMKKQKYNPPKSNLEYVSKKVKMIAAGVKSDEDVLTDEVAIMYEMAVGVTYGVAPLQHEYNYKKIMEATSLANAANIVRNPRYFALSPAPMMKDNPIPTVEWRVLPSTANDKLIANYFRILTGAIALTDSVKSVYIKNIDGIDYIVIDGEYYPNSIESWLHLTGCEKLNFSSDDLYGSDIEYSGEWYPRSDVDAIDEIQILNLLSNLLGD